MSTEEKMGSGVRSGTMTTGQNWLNFKVNQAALAYAMTTLGASMINNIFSFYYVKLFINEYKTSETAFHQSQLVFMVWNAFNDPLFGYLQDNSRMRCCSQRRLSILYGAPLYSLSFLLPWFPWRSYYPGDWLSGLHLMVALCAFDGLLTFVLLAQCALFAEISSNHRNRIRLVQYGQVLDQILQKPAGFSVRLSHPVSVPSQVASLMGSSSILFCGVLSRNMEDFAAFQAFSVLVAVLSCCCMLYTGFYSQSRYDYKGCSPGEACIADQTPPVSFAMLRTLMWQILTNGDFQLFVTMNFFQVFMVAFLNNFTMIFTEQLIPANVLPPLAKSLMYGAGFICPQLLVLSCQRLLHDIGYYRIILYTFYLEAGLAALVLVLGPQRYYVLAFFLTFTMVLIQACFSLFGLPLADIIDADLLKHKRSSPLSSMVFGTNALFTKPGQSLAPMMVLSILNQFGYERRKDAAEADLQLLHSVMFYLVCLVPMCVATVQALVWRRYSIRNSHTVDTKYIDS